MGRGRGGKQRLDERLVAQGLAESRHQARGLILSGAVLVDDVPVDKAGVPVASSPATMGRTLVDHAGLGSAA